MKNFYLILFLAYSLFSFAQTQCLPNFSDSSDFKNRGATSDMLMPDSTNLVWQNGVSYKFDSLSNFPTLITDTINGYPVNTKEFVYMNVCDPYAFGDYCIQFTHRFDTDSLADGGFVEMSFDTGQTWVNVFDYTDGTVPFPYVMMSTDFGNSSTLLSDSSKSTFHGDGKLWRTNTIAIIFFIVIKTNTDSTCPFPMWLRFGFVSDSINSNKPGWEIGKVEVSWQKVSSISENRLKLFDVFPNPAERYIELDLVLNTNESLKYSITNIVGETIGSGALSHDNLKVSVENLPSGVYFITLPEKGLISKFIKK